MAESFLPGVSNVPKEIYRPRVFAELQLDHHLCSNIVQEYLLPSPCSLLLRTAAFLVWKNRVTFQIPTKTWKSTTSLPNHERDTYVPVQVPQVGSLNSNPKSRSELKQSVLPAAGVTQKSRFHNK